MDKQMQIDRTFGIGSNIADIYALIFRWSQTAVPVTTCK